MHNVLDTQDTFELIVSHCTDDASSLASLARTCRTISNPCLSLLYSTHAVPFWSLAERLPNTRQIAVTDFGHSSSTVLDKTLFDTLTWKRFDWYASKVRCLSVQAGRVRTEIFRVLALRLKLTTHSCLFESLHTLSILCPSDLPDEHSSSDLYLPFLVPTIRDLRIRVYRCSLMKQLCRAWPEIPELCPPLESLIIAHDCRGDKCGPSTDCLEILVQSDTWRSLVLEVDTLEDEVMMHILSLPHLESLSLKFTRQWCFPEDSRFEDDALQSLHTLYFDIDSTTIDSVLNMMNRAPLRTVSLILFNFSDSDEVQETLNLLVEKSIPSTMEYLFIQGLKFCTATQPTLLAEDLQILYVYRNLQILTITSYQLPIRDEDILALSKSWRNLRVLKLGGNESMELTLMSLVHLSVFCAGLEWLEISVDMQSAPELASLGIEQVNLALQKLDLCCSHDNFPAGIRYFLKRVFPNAVLIDDFIRHDSEEES